jgi:hypothetical protein
MRACRDRAAARFAALINRHLPEIAMLATLTGFRFFERDHRGRFELRFSWAEISGGFGFAAALCLFEDHYSLHVRLGWPNIFIKLPILQRWHHDPYEGMESWGLSLYLYDAHLNWGRRCRIVHFPWSWEWQRTSVLMPDGRSWVHELRGHNVRHGEVPCELPTDKRWWSLRDVPRWQRQLPYRYVLRSGEVQERTATISVEEREWRMRWTQWLPWPRRLQRTIDVQFSDEVGERSGSWKGGCVGCGYQLLPGEMAEECLRRMERDRKF